MTAITDHQKQNLATREEIMFDLGVRLMAGAMEHWERTPNIIASMDGIHPPFTKEQKAALEHWERTAAPAQKEERKRQLEEIYRQPYGCCATLETHNYGFPNQGPTETMEEK